MRFVSFFALSSLVFACGGSQPPVTFMSNEQPTSESGSPNTSLSKGGAHIENPNGGAAELGEDLRVEPEHPLGDNKQERALVHIHGPKDMVCSGVVLGPKLVATTQRCVKGLGKGVNTLGADDWRIEVASSAVSWTNRKGRYAVVPSCEWHELDIAVFVLDEPVPAMVEPLKIMTAPDTGGKVQALGFGQCAGSPKLPKDRVGEVKSRDSQTVTIDVALCKGDRGGPVVDQQGADVIGIVSHRDDPEGSPLRTSTIARLDTVWARDLLTQAKGLADGGDIVNARAVACR